MPKNTKHVPTKGQERPPPVSAIDKIPVAIPIVSNGLLGYRMDRNPYGLHVAKSNAGRSAVHDEEIKPDPMISTDLTLQDDATRLPIMTNNGTIDSSKRKASSIRMHTGISEPTAKRPKNKQKRPAISDTEDNPSNDEDRKPAAKDTTPTPDGVPSSTCPSNDEDRKPAAKDAPPTPDGVPSTCAGLKRKSTSTRTGSVVSMHGQGIKREPIIKTETASAPATTDPSTDQVEAPIPTEPVINGPNLNLTVTVRRKVAKRSDPLFIAPSPQTIPTPPPPSPQAEEIPARKKRRIEEPLPTTTDEAAKKTAPPDLPEGLPPPATPPPCTATVNVSSRRQSRRQARTPLIETSETQPDDANAADDGDLSGRTPHLAATVNAPTSRRSSRRVIPTSSTGTTAPPPSTATVDVSTHRRSQRQTRLPLIETREAQPDDTDDANAADDGDLSGSSWEKRLNELADYHKIHGHCNVPRNYNENTKLGRWVSKQRHFYKLRPSIDGGKGHRHDEFANKYSQKLLTAAPSSNASGRQRESMSAAAVAEEAQQVTNEEDLTANTSFGRESPISIDDSDDSSEEALSHKAEGWAKKFQELCEYSKSKGHCTFRWQDPEYAELSKWVFSQRCECRRIVRGKRSILTPERLKALECIGFVWNPYTPSLSHIQELERIAFERGVCVTAWENRLSELADYRKFHGHCNVPESYGDTKLATWVESQGHQYSLHLEGKASSMTLSRLKGLESVGFERDSHHAFWEGRLSELADYHKIQGHCNVPIKYSENSKLGTWVTTQRKQYKLRREGNKSKMTIFRIQELESLGFEWSRVQVCSDAWEVRLSELTDYRKIHGHCNVPIKYSENIQLGTWVMTQRTQYKLRREGKPSHMTLPRIQALEILGFRWRPSIDGGKGKPKKSSLDDNATCARERAVEAPEHAQITAQTKEDFSTREIRSNQVDVIFEPQESDWNGNGYLTYIPGRTEEI
jgi:hypothetical protein